MKAMKPKPLNWISAMLTNPGLATTITHLPSSTQVDWTPGKPNAKTNEKRGIGPYNDKVGESNGE